MKESIAKLPDFMLIEYANDIDRPLAPSVISLIDQELDARYESVKHELKLYDNELPF